MALWSVAGHLAAERLYRRNIKREVAPALVQLNGDIFFFYNKSLGDLNVEKFTHQTPSKS